MLQRNGRLDEAKAWQNETLFFAGWVVELGSRPEAEHALAEDWRPAPAEDHPSGPSVLLTHRYFKISL